MENVKKWVTIHKKACFLTGIAGLVLVPFLWPVFLAVLVQCLTLGLPILVGTYFYQYLKKEKTNENEHECRKPQTDAAASSKIFQNAEAPHAVSETENETLSEPVNATGTDQKEKKKTIATSWYENEGRVRLTAICQKATQEGKNGISINREGICTIPAQGGYQRIGLLKGFPKEQKEDLIKLLKQDGYQVRLGGNYLWLYWKRGEFK